MKIGIEENPVRGGTLAENAPQLDTSGPAMARAAALGGALDARIVGVVRRLLCLTPDRVPAGPLAALACDRGIEVAVRRLGAWIEMVPPDSPETPFDMLFVPHGTSCEPDVRAMFERLNGRLRPGGHLLLTCANPNSLCAGVEGPEWRWRPRVGTMVGGLPQLRQVLQDAGFELIDVRTGAGEYPRDAILALLSRLRPSAPPTLLSQLLARLEAAGAGEELVVLAKKRPHPAVVPGRSVDGGRVFALNVPKGGTWLLARAIELVTGRRSPLDRLVRERVIEESERTLWGLPVARLERALAHTGDDEYLIAHLEHDSANERAIARHGFRPIFVVRDPRDRTVSLAHWIRKFPAVWPHLQGLEFDELLLLLIDPSSRPDLVAPPSGDELADRRNRIQSVVEVYSRYLPWMMVPCVATVRFEDLVGDVGGGSDRARTETLCSIARHLGVSLTPSVASRLGGELFGARTTGHGSFRNGVVGAWREVFDARHVAAFTAVGGDRVVAELGYTPA